MRIFRPGDRGPEIGDIQERLSSLGADLHGDEPASFGEATLEAVRAFQAARHLRVDGLVGPDTWGQLVEAGFRLGDRTLYLRAPHMRGDDVVLLQRKLNALGFDAGREDGVHGPMTDRAVREFQRNVGEEPDGVVGLHTIETLERMRPVEGAASRAVVREEESLLGRPPGLAGGVVAIDPGPSPDDADTAYALASAIAAEIRGAGGTPQLLRPRGTDPSAHDRAVAANRLGATLCICLHTSGERGGASCASFGSERTHSPSGERLAGLIADELEGEFGEPVDRRRLTVAMLRETAMPAVQVEPPAGAGDPGHIARIARAVAAGVRRYRTEPAGG